MEFMLIGVSGNLNITNSNSSQMKLYPIIMSIFIMSPILGKLSMDCAMKNYQKITIEYGQMKIQMKEGYKDGILLGEILQNTLQRSVKNQQNIFEKAHPSYSVRIGSWEWCSLFHVIQILNKKYEIFTHPIAAVVADRNMISNLDTNYEQYEDNLFSIKNGFCLVDAVYEYAKHSPQTIPFYIHGNGKNEDWKNEVLEFCEHNNLSNPKFVD